MNWVSIDFGTSYSAATVMIDGKPVKVHPMGGLYNMYGFPTVAYVNDKNEIKVCNDAIPWRCHNPERFIKDFKLNIHENELAFIGVTYSQIITEILKAVKRSAEYAIGNDPIECAIITVPATYADNDPRKQIMLEAAKNAGFREVEFVKEAEAAAIYYHNVQKSQTGTLTLIYDLGGGTFDPALIEHTEDGYKILGCISGKECGGKYFEAALYRQLKSRYDFNFSEDENIRIQQIDGIAKLCKDIKEGLSTQERVSYPVPLMSGLTIEYSREEFSQLIKPLLEKTFQECATLVQSAGKKWSDVDRILLIGGSTAIPCVKTYLQKYLAGQNCADIPVIQNKSEEGLHIDTLFAVSIGGMLHKFGEKEAHKTEKDNAESSAPEGTEEIAAGQESLSEDTPLTKAQSYKNNDGDQRNWIKAAYWFNEDYKRNQRISSYEEMVEIYQLLLDNLSIKDGNMALNPIVDTTGRESAEQLVDILLYLQNDLETRGQEAFLNDIFNIQYWTTVIEELIEK